MKRIRPPALSPEALDEFAQAEKANLHRLRLIAASPDRSPEERIAAFNEGCGICFRLGSMLLTSLEQKAASTAAARERVASTAGVGAERIRDALIEAERQTPNDRRGRRKAVDSLAAELAGVSPKTISRHRQK
jgi:hypothetical protein